jgi:hypothetical protein
MNRANASLLKNFGRSNIEVKQKALNDLKQI